MNGKLNDGLELWVSALDASLSVDKRSKISRALHVLQKIIHDSFCLEKLEKRFERDSK